MLVGGVDLEKSDKDELPVDVNPILTHFHEMHLRLTTAHNRY
jgi:hypothetical protein